MNETTQKVALEQESQSQKRRYVARAYGQHNITADVEVIPIQKINEAHERLLKSDVQ
jgi:D-arabinose 1-dehydrogenase-like Zn-dependent alcohol dehydrogenase